MQTLELDWPLLLIYAHDSFSKCVTLTGSAMTGHSSNRYVIIHCARSPPVVLPESLTVSCLVPYWGGAESSNHVSPGQAQSSMRSFLPPPFTFITPPTHTTGGSQLPTGPAGGWNELYQNVPVTISCVWCRLEHEDLLRQEGGPGDDVSKKRARSGGLHTLMHEPQSCSQTV